MIAEADPQRTIAERSAWNDDPYVSAKCVRILRVYKLNKVRSVIYLLFLDVIFQFMITCSVFVFCTYKIVYPYNVLWTRLLQNNYDTIVQAVENV